VTLIAAVLVTAGFALTAVSWGFLVLAAVGAFGPGILRELGWVRDKDELQMQAAYRAGYHAYLAGGLVAMLLIARVRSSAADLSLSDELGTAILSVMWFTWLISSLHAYWGGYRTAQRILIIFGSVWLLFNILGNLQGGVTALLMQSLLAVPFFALAWLARRWPRPAGVLLLGTAAFCGYFFHLYEVFGADPFSRGRIEVAVLFMGPLLACGLMLLADRDSAGDGVEGGLQA